ncbi:4-hydroxybenzoate octaprenyltransferase [Oceanicoccus sagamiensis]|uniref:4-hydroxybenzoate octaprenyltransferase n=1 Tax=Oceanicoccus sagamiensis TaxID=716816 RepID=A0A1X9N8B0_9GAMM|nr:4-hydroxybenzoate octaprenyltransferase [Oceanicoccus sagamiensis]ARN73916.1 4-hydroxybenzoate polyprenyltransferase [Oceanicoccus sagamiensis]
MTTLFSSLRHKTPDYLALIRFDRPIGTYLLLWPTLWALWIAAEGLPDLKLLVIFILGTFLMRSAGCAINDFADRKIDAHVKRTANRPLATGKISSKEALIFTAVLCLLAFVLVLFTNPKTIALSFAAVALAACYPFMKRYTQLPQVVLGAAFSWGIPMAFAAQQNALPKELWLLYFAVVIWTVAYDTFYAMVDRDDDIQIGVKSTAILFGQYDRLITGLLQVIVLVLLVEVGRAFGLGQWYFLSLIVTALLFVYQQYLIRHRDRDNCFKAFLNNHWAGAIIFGGIALSYYHAG